MGADALRQLYRESFGIFAQRFIREVAPNLELDWNWHHDLICDRLERLSRGEIQRLLICVPPRSLKSLLCSVLFPAWLLGIRPSEAVLCVSYAQPLAEGFARQTRQVMESQGYKTTFRTRISREKRAAEHFETMQGGMRIASSVGGTVTGRGGDTIILDDLMKPEEAASEAGRRSTLEWLGGTLASRPNSKLRVRMLCIMQRLHEQDVAAELISHGGWEVLSLPAMAVEAEEHIYDTVTGQQVIRRAPGDLLHPEREPQYVLDDLRRQMGSFRFEAQYQQQPVPEDGNLFRRSWVRSYSPAEAQGFDRIIHSWDTAGKDGQHNDFSVGTTWGLKRGHSYLLEVHREKLAFPALRDRVIELARRFEPERVLIEDQASGIALIQELHSMGFYKVIAFKPKGSKVERLHGVTPMFESGHVLLPDAAGWLEAYLHELCAFPRGRHDDQVDSTTQALEWIRTEGQEPGLIGFYRQEFERQRAYAEDRTVRMKAPASVSTVILLDGTTISVPPDGMILVTPESARPLRLAGWAEVPLH
ncbi:MAG: phage terminase large subunit [Pseudomonadota bacterium]|nr:phage terminase large subunit [Pseudomonadota bacterium]